MLLPSISSSAKSSVTLMASPWKEEVLHYLIKKTLTLFVYKYDYERCLRRQLGFMSFPVTEILMDLILGFKKLKGSSIHLPSDTDWKCVIEKLHETKRPQQQVHQAALFSAEVAVPLMEVEVLSTSPDIDLESEDTSQLSFQPPFHNELPSVQDDRSPAAEEQEENNLSEHMSLNSSDTGSDTTQPLQPEFLEDDRVYDSNIDSNDEVETYGFMSKGEPQGPFSDKSSSDEGVPSSS